MCKKFLFTFYIASIILLLVSVFSYAASEELQTYSYKVINQHNINYIVGISADTTLEELLSNISFNSSFQVFTSDGSQAKNTDLVKTGMYISINNNLYYLVVGGDVNGDGKITQTDLLKIRSHIVMISPLEDSFLQAADLGISASITATDILQMKRILVNLMDQDSLYKYSSSNNEFSYTTYKLTNSIRLDRYLDEYYNTVTIPEQIQDSPVVSLGKDLFAKNYSIKTIEISKNIMFIPLDLLQRCANLESINISKGNTNYLSQDGILYSSDGKTLISYPPGKTNVSYLIEETVQSLGPNCFSNALLLKQLFVPSAVTYINDSSFENWSGSVYGDDDSSIINFAKSNNLPYVIDKPPVVEQITQSNTPSQVSGFSFLATDDAGIVAWTITKSEEAATNWTKITSTLRLNATKDNITENGKYIIWLKDCLNHVTQKEVTVNNIDYTPPTVTSINIISPGSGEIFFGETVTIRVTFSEIIKGSAPTLLLNVGGIAGIGTMQPGVVSGTTNYIDYIYTTAKQAGLITIASYSGGNLTDLAGNIAIINTKENTGNQVTIKIANGNQIANTGVYIIPPVDISQTYIGAFFDSGHLGLDIYKNDRTSGLPIYACADGTITRVNRGDGFVYIDHGNGVVMRYGHMLGDIVHSGAYAVGRQVKQGEQIGTMASQGISGLPAHLHLEIIINGTEVDPLTYLPELLN